MDFINLFSQDQKRFDKPAGWRNKDVEDSPIIHDWHSLWKELSGVYMRELPDLAYMEIPSIGEIETSISELLTYIR